MISLIHFYLFYNEPYCTLLFCAEITLRREEVFIRRPGVWDV